MSEWKSIKTAPEGGIPFLAFEPEGDDNEARMAVCYYSISGSLCFEVSGGFADDNYDGTRFRPTHWMPLPEPPKE